MRLSAIAASLGAPAIAAATANYSLSDTNKGIAPGAYIVEFTPEHTSVDSFYQNLSSNGIHAVQRRAFDHAFFSGTSFHLPANRTSDLDVIGNFTQVKAISPVRLFSHGSPISRDKRLSKVEALARSNKKRALQGAPSSHVMAGVDKLHAEGIDGSGIMIAEIDTGIDYTLPALGGCFGPGCKISFGYDLVGNNYTGANTPVPDNDPLDCNGHGTHVAGIIAASDDPYVLGVAPNVTLGIYKVFGCSGDAANDVLIDAFLMAYNHGVDIITSSIGGASGWPEEPWAAVTASIVAAGTPCMLAAGNDGSDGMFYASSASAGDDVTSVGSVDNIRTPSASLLLDYVVDGASTETTYNEGSGSFTGVSLPLYANSFNTSITNDFCSAITANLTGKIALIRRGTCTFEAKADVAKNAGAAYVMFYNNIAGTMTPSLGSASLTGAGMVSADVGTKWVGLLAAGKTVTLTFPDKVELLVDPTGSANTVSGGRMSTFSTWNPTNELTIKPVVSAPGGNILSTYLSDKGGYAVESGTSMATPFTAGVVALYLQAKGRGISPKLINAALSGSATPLVFNNGTADSSYLTSVAQQGGGLVNAYAMIRGGLSVTEANLALNDTAHHVQDAAFYVQNDGTTTETYTLSHAPAANAYAFDASYTGEVAEFPPPMDTKYATVQISPSTLTLEPGQKKRVTVEATPDASLDTTLVPFYSGFVNITGGGSSVSIPYGGVSGNMHDIVMMSDDGPWPYVIGGFYNTTNTTKTYKPSAETYPSVIFESRWGSAAVRIDVVSTTGPNLLHEAGMNITGSIAGFPLMWTPRSFLSGTWDGSLADGTTATSGTYKFVVRLAKVFADLAKGREYETYETVEFVMDMS
ncbi:subtilisin-like protease [Grosmannia clavigera kw1407]|uniref:Subtilisin-like protease n=1 Tax=Grosmannia clavigera (strain kw1407 / UAMH 11150) TaxID=655863 RepID=F0X9V8_GROCL|nr:subtilisin-like protease [Grosmannia clavigera kw1407]EFX05799.1 subtilisin-like protease [Grosmannia clavigera kw1407]